VRYANIAWCSLERTWAIIWRDIYITAPPPSLSLCVVHIIWYSSRLYSTFIDYYDTRPRGDDIHTGAGLLNKKKMFFVVVVVVVIFLGLCLIYCLFVCDGLPLTCPFMERKLVCAVDMYNIVVDIQTCAHRSTAESNHLHVCSCSFLNCCCWPSRTGQKWVHWSCWDYTHTHCTMQPKRGGTLIECERVESKGGVALRL
jgi:hypothetical protein